MKIRCLHVNVINVNKIQCHNDIIAKPELGYRYFNKINVCSVAKFVVEVRITVISAYVK